MGKSLKPKLSDISDEQLKVDYESILKIEKDSEVITEKYEEAMYGTLYGLRQLILKELGRRHLNQ